LYITRAKDFNDPFRIVTYRNPEEMEKVVGRLDDNPFIRLVREDEQRFEEMINKLTPKNPCPRGQKNCGSSLA
jgi:hypothetical protein